MSRAPPAVCGKRQRGFTLLEVIVALSILAISLTVLMQSQAVSLGHAGRSRDIAIATLLARSKMVDVEQRLFHEGFVVGEQSAHGDFADEGYAAIKWATKVSEVELDLTNLLGMCEGLSGRASKGPRGKAVEAAGGAPSNDCGSMMQSLGSLGGLLAELGRSMRAAEVTVTWPQGRFEERFVLRALLTRDDYQTLQEGDAAKNAERLQSAGIGGADGPTGVPVGMVLP